MTHETKADYLEGVAWLEKHGFKIYGIVVDGMWGLMQELHHYPVQMYQFHQIMIVRRYLAEDPDLDASKALLELVNSITVMDKESFVGAFNEWYEKYRDVLNELVHDRRIKRKTPPYMRPKLRSAYLSVKRHMPWLWTFYDYRDRVIPNTNNGLEGIFSDIKSKVRVHSGISKEHRMKLIDEYLTCHYQSSPPEYVTSGGNSRALRGATPRGSPSRPLLPSITRNVQVTSAATLYRR